MSSNLKQLALLNVATRLVHSASGVNSAITSLAQKISRELEDTNPLVITVLNGGVVFTGKLLPLLPFPLQQDYLHASRYGNAQQGSDLQWFAYPASSLHGRTVLLLDDIFDRGLTLQAVREYCLKQGAKAVFSAVLLEKQFEGEPEGDKSSYRPDFIGLTCEDKFVIGCGMDCEGYGRNLPAIYEVLDIV